jgi:hypothetical protein
MNEDTSTNTCTCSGYLKEINYVVQVTFQNNTSNASASYYTITSVNATLIISNDAINVTCGDYSSV